LIFLDNVPIDPGTYKYYLTRLGRKVVTTALKLKTMFIIPSLAEPVKMAA
jgi:hypothetical protein